MTIKQNLVHWYDKNYKITIAIPIIIFIASIIYLFGFYAANGDIMYKDVSLAGGTVITLDGTINPEILERGLPQSIPDISFRKLTDVGTGRIIATVIETSEEPEVIMAEISKLGIVLTEENSSVEFTGPSLSNQFYKQLAIALTISFILMAFVIFILFKTFVPSVAIIFAAFSDMVIALAILNLFEVKLSAAGIAAFLMLVGYSVDTNILLTTRSIKNKTGFLDYRMFGAFKTGILMTTTALAAILPALLFFPGLPTAFKQIFLVLATGLLIDVVNTWVTNAGIIKWYCRSKGIQ